jgi:hypothetical protein
MADSEYIEVTTNEVTDKVTVVVCKHGGSSSEAVRLVQLLTDTDKEPDGGFRGFLDGVTWKRPHLSGESHTLCVRGERRDGVPVELIIHRMSAGFVGSGSLDAVAILVHLDLGPESYLQSIVTARDPSKNPHDSWKVSLGPEVLTPHIDFK